MIIGTLRLRRDLYGRPSMAAARRLLRLGLPLAPAIVGTLISEFLIRLTLLQVAGAEEVAFFTVGNRFASVAALSLVVLQLAWVPRAYAIAESGVPSSRRRIGQEGTWVVALVSIAVLAVAAGAQVIVTVAAGSAYIPALPPLGLSLVAVVGLATYLIASMPSAVARRTEDLAVATGLAAIIGVVGTLLLAEPLQAIGAAGSLAVGQFAAVAVVGVLGLRTTSLGIEWRRVLPIVGVTCAATLLLVMGTWLPVRIGALLMAVATIAVLVRLPEGIRIARRALRR
jgi:O-antigen/teichoic acid export membrane protein